MARENHMVGEHPMEWELTHPMGEKQANPLVKEYHTVRGGNTTRWGENLTTMCIPREKYW